MKELILELNEIKSKLLTVGKFSAHNIAALESIFYYYKTVYTELVQLDKNTFYSYTIVEVEPKIDLLLSDKVSVSRKRDYYNEAVQALLSAVGINLRELKTISNNHNHLNK